MQEWFGWTEAAERAFDVRAAVEKKERLRDAKGRFQQEEADENLDDMEREVRASEERQADAKRRVEEARKAARLLAGEN